MGTADVSYVPGTLTAVIGDQCWALVEISPDSQAVARVWRQLGRGAAADALLAGLVADGIGDTPAFALLVAGGDGQRRLFCRGTVGATIVTPPSAADARSPGGPVAVDNRAALARVDGAGLLTWHEQVVGNAQRVFLGDPPADAAMRLPARSGVLLANCVVVDCAGIAAPGRTAPYFPDTVTVTHPGGTSAHPADADVGGQGWPDSRPPSAPAAPTAPFMTSLDGLPGVPSAPGALSAPSRPSGQAPDRSPAGPARHAAAEADGRPDGDGEYDFLWGATQARSVEDAAMREISPPDRAPLGHPAPNGVTAASTGGPPPGLPPAGASPDGGPAARSWPSPPGQVVTEESHFSPPGTAGSPIGLAPPAGPPSEAVTLPPGLGPARPPGGLIDMPPWLSGAGESAPGPAWGRPGGPAPDWGPPGQPPAVSSAPAAPSAVAAPGESGSPVKRGELPEIVTVTTPPDRIGPVVPALLCPRGHVNPPSGTVCRRCGAPLPHDPVPVPRPVLGALRLSLGDMITLDRGVLMGRNPRAELGAEGVERPHVVKLPSADGDISRTHLKVTLDGWHVLVTDLNSTNGTLVTLPGRDPQQLRPGEPMPIQPGTVVTLANGIDFRYEVTD